MYPYCLEQNLIWFHNVTGKKVVENSGTDQWDNWHVSFGPNSLMQIKQFVKHFVNQDVVTKIVLLLITEYKIYLQIIYQIKMIIYVCALQL